MSLEVHVCTREDLLPDPQKDPLTAVFYAIQTDSDDLQLKIGELQLTLFHVLASFHRIFFNNV